jgi:hypothetical protein
MVIFWKKILGKARDNQRFVHILVTMEAHTNTLWVFYFEKIYLGYFEKIRGDSI